MARSSMTIFWFAVDFFVTCAQSQAQGLSIQARIRNGLVGLALQPEIAKEIGIADDAEAMAEILRWSEASMAESRKAIAEAYSERQTLSEETRREFRTRYDSELKSFLTPLQVTRLQQIDWQIRDHNALTDPNLMFALRMTEAQQEKLLKAQQVFITKRRELTTARRELNIFPADFDKQTKESIAGRDRSVDEILTKRQRDKFTELKGKPFDGPEHYWYENNRGGGSKPQPR